MPDVERLLPEARLTYDERAAAYAKAGGGLYGCRAIANAASAKQRAADAVVLSGLREALKDVCDEAENAIALNDAPSLREAVKEARALLDANRD